jgi:N-acetyl-anhydromuramyl-L-alanine amidase AmpD
MAHSWKTWLALTALATATLACGPLKAPVLSEGATGLFALTKATIAPPKATEMPSPNFNERGGVAIDTIVLHHTAMASNAVAVGKYFQDPKSKVSSHYVVDRDGSIVRCVPDNQRSWHAGRSAFQGRGDVNTFSIGIEICNVGDGVEPYPAAQVKAVINLTAWLAKTYKVAIPANLTRHRDIALPAGRKNDTSDNFNHVYVAKAVQDVLAGHEPAVYKAGSVPTGYDPTKLTYTVQKGDTWESISDDVYDTPTLAEALRRLNGGIALKPGLVIKRVSDYR